MMQGLSSREWQAFTLSGTIRIVPGSPKEFSTTKDVSERLRQLRAALAISQAQLCRRAGIEANAWNNYEKGRNRISVDHAIKVKRAFGVTLDWIYHADMGGVRSDIAEKIAATPVENVAPLARSKRRASAG